MSDLDKIFRQINNAVLDAQSAQSQTFGRPMSQLSRAINHDYLRDKNRSLIENVDLLDFLEESKKTGGGMVGSHQLAWPDDPKKVLGITLLLIEKFGADPDFAIDFSFTYFYAGSKISSNLHSMIRQLIIPFVRDYKDYVCGDFFDDENTNQEGDLEGVSSNVASGVKNMKVFVSHSSKDAKCAEAFVDLVRAATGLGSKEIRCTSVDGYRLPAGAESDSTLRQEVFDSVVFVGLLSPAGLASNYVIFELGARWGSRRYLAPVLIAGIGAGQLRPPLSAMHAANGGSEADMHDLMKAIAGELGVDLEAPASYLKQLKIFAQEAMRITTGESSSNSVSIQKESVNATKKSSARKDLRGDVVVEIEKLYMEKGKAAFIELTDRLADRYDFGTVLGELMLMRDLGRLRWDGDQNSPPAYAGIELL